MATPLVHEDELEQILDEQPTNTSSFTRFFRRVGSAAINTANAAGDRWRESSTLTRALIVGTGVGLAAPLAILPVLGAVGFTSAGVAAGSMAASMQTATTVSGSIFALCQSAAATGVVATSTSVGVGLAAGATAGGVTAAVLGRSPDEPGNPQAPTPGEVVVEEEEEAQPTSDLLSVAAEELTRVENSVQLA